MIGKEEKNLSDNEAGWRLLSIINLVRLLAGGLLIGIFKLAGSSSGWGSIHPDLFFWSAIALLVSSVIFGLIIRGERLSQDKVALFGSISDSLLFCLLMHASGPASQGIGVMLLMSVCAAALILNRQMAMFSSALAFIFLLSQNIIAEMGAISHAADYSSIGLLGASLLLSSWAIQSLGERYRLAERLALERGVDIANLSQLNDYVVQRLREGVMVVDGQGKTRLMNLSAARMLDVSDSKEQATLAELSPQIHARWKNAVDRPYEHHNESLTLDGLSRIVPSFIPLGHRRDDGMLIFLEDTSILQERVQQTKLAALGRLSASIAHEIRNPLAAISHAEQLLSESESLEGEDRYFTGLIKRHVARVNEIVENVLSLSRASTGKPEEIELREWIIDFVIEYMQLNELGSNQIHYHFPKDEDEIVVPFAKSQLRQIIENIFDNAISHSGMVASELRIKILVAKHKTGRWGLVISDNGKGFREEDINEIFEPFHSGNSQSSGLGLYISRELASLNRANLSASNSSEGHATFELIFADIKRWKN